MSDAKKYPLSTVRKAWGAGRASAGNDREQIWVVADAGCYAGKQIKRNNNEVEIELLDAVMLVGCGLAGDEWLTGELRRFPVEKCRFFNDVQAMANCVFRLLEARGLGRR